MEYVDYVRFLLALLLVLGLIFVLAWVARRYGPEALARRDGRRSAGGRRRLGVVEALPLDARRRLVLVRCDHQEYLLVTSPNRDLVVASVTSGEGFDDALAMAARGDPSARTAASPRMSGPS